MQKADFNPYADNGGSILAIAGNDFCIVAADTRQSDGYLINTRYSPKATDRCVIGTSGFHADGLVLVKNIKAQLHNYRHAHDKVMTCQSIAQMLSVMLYSKRFFPYYTFNILGGLDEKGVGAVYSYDPVGSFEREGYRAGGSASALIQPFLDSQIGLKNWCNGEKPQLTLERAIKVAKDAFTSATERDIYTGDCLEIFTITRDGVRVTQHPLKRD